ncbi:MAG TPA: hypothetical protein VMC80_00810 [Patescibacteria group bacterium]|nr:hypothetical protein [Patescibacteria group bacterium]
MDLENNGISVDPRDYMKFMTDSLPVGWPIDNVEKRKVINRNFRGSCMMVKTKEGFQIGELNWTDAVGYSMTINGEEMRFSYSETEALFKPKLC